MEPNTDDKSLPTVWRVPGEMWQMAEPILLEHDLQQRLAASVFRHATRLRRSFFACAQVVSGIICPKSSHEEAIKKHRYTSDVRRIEEEKFNSFAISVLAASAAIWQGPALAATIAGVSAS